jgi:phenylalanyl-tRNA synthetase beta chain
MPATFTVGALSILEQFSDRLREEMIGFGFQEIVSNVLGSRQDFIERMRIEQGGRPETRVVEIENPMTERFSLLRPWLLPSLLRVEGASSKAFYPHRIFEVGEVAQLNALGDKTETSVHLAALISHPTANFSELHAVLEALFYSLSVKYRLDSISHPTFMEGRTGVILVNEQEVGLIGEVAPEILSRWQIGMPSVAIEIQVESLSAKESKKKIKE